MMSEEKNANDTFRHRNLERLGRELSLPARAGAERQARWQSATMKVDSSPTNRGFRFMKQHKWFAFLTSSAAAAIIIVAVWLGVAGATPVSAAAIFDGFKAAVQRALSIRLEGIDLGTVTVNGDLILDRSPHGSRDDTRYAEVHVLLKADDPEWNDLDAVIVIYQSPDNAWQYCRGNGGSCAEEFHVDPTEYLIEGEAWDDFVNEPLESFGGMPLRLSFSAGDSGVTYRFMRHQRAYVEQLLRFLLDISSAETTGELIEELQAAAGSIHVEQKGEAVYVLEASGFGRIEALEVTDVPLPHVDTLLQDVIWELRYDLTARQIVGTSIKGWPAALREAGIISGSGRVDLPTESAETLVHHLKGLAHKVDVEETGENIRTIRVVGYPLPLDTSSRDWRDQIMRGLLDDMTLSIYYDAEARSVTRAEFHGVGSPEGRIILEIGRVKLDPARLSPGYWSGTGMPIDDPVDP